MVACVLVAACAAERGVYAASPSDDPGADLFASISRIKIELPPDALASLRRDAREFVAGTVSDGTTVYSQVAVKLKGGTGSFRSLEEKPAITLDFCRFQPGRKFHGLRRVHLNNSVEDPSYTNEKLGSELFQAAGVPAPRVTRALVALNGRAQGVYVLKEGFTEDFLARHFQKVGGELYEPGNQAHDVDKQLERVSVAAPFDKSGAALKKLSRLVGIEAAPEQRWRELEATLDMKRFVAFMATEILVGHRDGYCLARNNYRVYHDLDCDKMVFFPHGMDQLLGTPELPWQPNFSGLVARAVMSTPEGKEAYAATFGSLLTNVFKVETLTNRVEQLTQELRPLLSAGEFAKVKAEAEVVKDHIAKRRASLLAQLARPALKPLAFTDGVGHPEGWEITDPPQKGRLDRVEVEGVAALHILAEKKTTASWRAKVLLPRGHYRFEGRARIAGVESLASGKYQGAGLRIGGNMRELATFIGDSPWKELAADFVVGQPSQEVELVCELRARRGEAWLDLASLRVRKLDDL